MTTEDVSAASTRGLTSCAAGPERPLVFECQGERLLGILHPAVGDVGVVVIVGGPQYRAGSHRQFVHLARALAAVGHPVLRFDMRGMGDSTGPAASFEHGSDDIASAIFQLRLQQPQVTRVVLWGLCDGASAVLLHLYAQPGSPVQGLCLVNPWVRSEASLARTHVKHYYRRRLLEREFWIKLLTGRIAVRAVRGLWDNLVAARGQPVDHDLDLPFQSRMAKAWAAFTGPILLVLSGDDYTAQEFVEYTSTAQDWQGLIGRPQVTQHVEREADHTFSNALSRLSLQAVTAQWLKSVTP